MLDSVPVPYQVILWPLVGSALILVLSRFLPDWARRLLAYARRRYDAAMAWFKSQGWWVKALGVAFAAAVVLATLWLLGFLDFAGELVHFEPAWLDSPIGIGA